MSRLSRQLRCALALAVIVGAAAGCGSSGSHRAADPVPTAWVTEQAASGAPKPAAAGGKPSRPAPSTSPDGTQAFAAGMAAYCTSFYSRQRDVEDQYPSPDLSSRISFARGTAEAARDTEALLGQLTPPDGLAGAFDAFVDNAHQVSLDRGAIVDALTSTGEEGKAGDAFSATIAARWPLAEQLDASGCDGKLPPAQEEAVIGAARSFETTEDSQVACGQLATPGFLQTRWSDLPDPLQGCVVSRDHQIHTAAGAPTDIVVQSVTGADGIAATIRYSLVGGCKCWDESVLRLHLVDGSWLVTDLGH
jgi:hypothetical protein